MLLEVVACLSRHMAIAVRYPPKVKLPGISIQVLDEVNTKRHPVGAFMLIDIIVVMPFHVS